MRAEVVKAWIGVIVTAIPLSWALFASADTVYGFVAVASALGLGCWLGYRFNQKAVHPALFIGGGYSIAFFGGGVFTGG